MIAILDVHSDEAAAFIEKLNLRGGLEDPNILRIVRKTLQDVQRDRDRAVIKYTRKLDAPAKSPSKRCESQTRRLMMHLHRLIRNSTMRSSLRGRNIERFSSEAVYEIHGCLPKQMAWFLGHLIRPLRRVGVCVPSVSQLLVFFTDYESGFLRGLRVFEEIAVFMGPMRNRKIDPHMLVAAAACGVREIYKCGGAQAVGAMAYGTATIPKVDKIVGPGNLYVPACEEKRSMVPSILTS